MDEKDAVREMFDGLFNIVTGPGFYTVDGVKRKKLKPHKQTSSEISNDVRISSENCQYDSRRVGSSGAESVEDSDYQSSDCGTRCGNSDDSVKERSVSNDLVSDLDLSSISESGQCVQTKSDRKERSPAKKTPIKADDSCEEGSSTEQTESLKSGDLSPSKFRRKNHPKCTRTADIQADNEASTNLKKDGCSPCKSSSDILKNVVNKSCDKNCIQEPDLVLSTRRGRRKDSPSKVEQADTSTKELVGVEDLLQRQLYGEEESNPIENKVGEVVLVKDSSKKEADAQSDISTDSRASGYTTTRSASTALPKPSVSREKTPACKPEKLPRCHSERVKKETNASKSRQKRKSGADHKDILHCAKKRRAEQRVLKKKTVLKSTQRKRHKSFPQVSSKATSQQKKRQTSTRKSQRIQQRLEQTDAKIQMWIGKQQKDSSGKNQQRLEQTDAKIQMWIGKRQKDSSGKNQQKGNEQKQKKNVMGRKVNPGKEKKKIPASISEQLNKDTDTRQTESRVTCKKAGGRGQTVRSSSENLLLKKQQKILAEHSRQAEKVEERSIMSALCQLEDKSKSYHRDDLDHIMPMRDLFSANQNTLLEVRGQGHNNHPGGIWKKLIPEN